MKFESIYLPNIEQKRPLLIAGPCSAETQEQVMATAKELHKNGVQIMRAGIWKPRTKPGGFEGVGAVGLKWLKEVKDETGMYVATEVATKKHVYEALKYGVDMLWIGARTTANPFAVQEVAEALKGVDIPVLVKNPISPDLELWIGALERLSAVGLTKVGAIHRGFSSFDKSVYRNTPQWYIPIELKRRLPELPILCDPSHIGGNRNLIEPLSQQAMDLGMEGLIIETHCDPLNAWSDSEQQITPIELKNIIDSLIIRGIKQSTEDLIDLRKKIDRLDQKLLELLSKRMNISAEIAIFKKENELSIIQPDRYQDILNRRITEAISMNMNPEFMRKVLQAIHEESVRVQLNIFNEEK